MHRIAAVALLSLVACERPKPLGVPPPAQPEQSPGLRDPAVPSRQFPPADGQSRGFTPPPPSKPVSALLAEYAADAGADKRHEILADLAGAAPSEGVPAVARLLELEKRASLRVALLDMLDGFDGLDSQKVAILRTELAGQRAAGEVREAALDALLNIQHRDAIPLWREIQQSGDDAERDIAAQAIAGLESL